MSLSETPETNAAGRPFDFHAKRVGKFILGQWLVIAMGIACMLAYFFPDVAKQGGYIQAQYSVLYGAVIVIFLLSGLSIPRDKLITHIMNYRLHIITQGSSYLLIPLLFFGGVYLIDATDTKEHLDRAVLAGYILLSCLPTTLSSNVIMTRAAGGDDAAALVEVLIANVLGPFITPGWAMSLMPKTPRFEKWASSSGGMGSIYASTFKELSVTVLVPLFVGQGVRWIFPNAVPKFMAKYKINKLSSICLLLLVWSSFSTCFSTHALEALSDSTVAFTTVMNVALYLFLTAGCFWLARPSKWMLPKPLEPGTKPSVMWKIHNAIIQRMPVGETIAICFCGPAKTTGLGIPLLYSMYKDNDMFDNARMSVPVILYTTQQIFAAHFMIHLFHWWGEKTKKIEEKGGVYDDEEAARPQTNSDVTIVEPPRISKEGADNNNSNNNNNEKTVSEQDQEPISRPLTAVTYVDGRDESHFPGAGSPPQTYSPEQMNSLHPLSTLQPGHSTASFNTTRTLTPEH
ncbi:hypothetical protein KEM56_001849 [Ascosphaera pollenicola]|nr:hypothetical protein KEM56_001849 [Ascosphaera pollenicola]